MMMMRYGARGSSIDEMDGSNELTMGTGPALVFFEATLRLSKGPYSSACSKYSS